jgi:alpha-maltose-1-phosphate synthase
MSGARLLGAALEPLEDYKQAATRTSRLFIELERSFPIVGFVQPALVGPQDWTAKLRAFHPKRDAWRGRAWLSPQAFWQRTLLAERELRVWSGEYDLIFQLQTLFAPGLDPTRPYAIYTDNTYTQTERIYPAWAPLGKRAASAWRELEQTTFRNARVVFGMSKWVCEAIVSDYGCEPERVVPVGAGANSIATGVEKKAYARRIALFVGNKFELKGVPTLLEAWSIVRERLPDAMLWIVGVDPRGPEANWPTVEWFGYVSDRRQLEQLYDDASLFVLPTQFEAFGHAVVEAMGNALPCVTSNVGALPELVEDGVTGLLVPPREPEALAEALIALLSDSARAEAMGQAGYAKVLAELTWRGVAERMGPHIEAAVASPG